jgi:hypothetical protein
MGEAKRREQTALLRVEKAVTLETAGGRVQLRWDDQAEVTPFGQMAFFIEFLSLTGLLEDWIASCPLSYTSPNAPDKRDVLGTWLLSILAGHKRYAHVTTIRSDGVNPALLGMSRVVSEDALRRALKAIDEETGPAWLGAHLKTCSSQLLTVPWILDVDTTVKCLYGHQEGAIVGYNPKKPGRPSHTYHTYLMAGLRQILDVDVLAGNESPAKYTMPGLLHIIDELPEGSKPRLVRGDCGFGSEPVIVELEKRGVPYLFKLRLTKNVQRYIAKNFWMNDWSDVGQGWEGREGKLKLTGWTRERRVVMLRRPLQGDVLFSAENEQLALAFAETVVPTKRYEYAVLVTDLECEVGAIAQLYRDRGDAENTFDELKNQWGWGGFTTSDLARCRLSAKAVALVYNWWSLFVRLANPKERLEAITSRPLLLSGIARKTSHGGQQYVTVTAMHGCGQEAKAMLSRISIMLKVWKENAEQFGLKTVWEQVCEYIVTAVTGFSWAAPPLLAAPIHQGVPA